MMLDDLDLEELGQNVLRPDRKRAFEVIAILAGTTESKVRDEMKRHDARGQKIPFGKLWTSNRISDPVVALESLASRGIVPHEWVSTHERDFLDDKRVPRSPIPSLEHVVSLASDVPGILLAEELASEIISRLARWIGPSPSPPWNILRNLEELRSGIDAATYERLVAANQKLISDADRRNGRSFSWRIGVHADANLRNRRWPTAATPRPNARFTGNEAMSFLSSSIRERAGFGRAGRELRGEVDDDEREVWAQARKALKCVEKKDGAKFSQTVAGWDAFDEISLRYVARRGLSTLRFFDPEYPSLGLSCGGTAEREIELPFSAIQSPFVPMLHLWNTGYVLEEITRQRVSLFSPRGLWCGRGEEC